MHVSQAQVHFFDGRRIRNSAWPPGEWMWYEKPNRLKWTEGIFQGAHADYVSEITFRLDQTWNWEVGDKWQRPVETPRQLGPPSSRPALPPAVVRPLGRPNSNG